MKERRDNIEILATPRIEKGDIYLKGLKKEKRTLLIEQKTPYLNNLSRVLFNMDYKKKISSLVDISGLSSLDVEKQLKLNAKKVYDESSICIRVDPANVISILNDGQIKNQFQTNTTNGGFSNQDVLKKIENRTMSVPTNSLPEDRPIYGMLFPNINMVDSEKLYQFIKFGPGFYYGDCIMVLNKKRIEPFTTITFCDSLYSESCGSTTLANDIKFDGGYDTIVDFLFKYESILNSNYYQKFFEECVSKYKKEEELDGYAAKHWGNYIETQIHGKDNHSLNIIEGIIFLEPVAEEVLHKLYQLRIPYRILSEEIKLDNPGKIM